MGGLEEKGEGGVQGGGGFEEGGEDGLLSFCWEGGEGGSWWEGGGWCGHCAWLACGFDCLAECFLEGRSALLAGRKRGV